MDYKFVGFQNTYYLFDDIIIVSTGSEYDHFFYVIKCFKKLDEDNLRINLQKRHFVKTKIVRLGYQFIRSSISPLENKNAANLAIPPPTTLKRLRPFLGSVPYISKIVPNLAQVGHPLRLLLEKSTSFLLTEIHPKHFNIIKEKIATSNEFWNYIPKLDVRVKCDASRSQIGAALEQNTPDGRKPIAFASCFLNFAEERYCVKEMELLGVVWSVDYFKYYF